MLSGNYATFCITDKKGRVITTQTLQLALGYHNGQLTSPLVFFFEIAEQADH